MTKEQRDEAYLQHHVELSMAVEAKEKQKRREQCPQAMAEWQNKMQAEQDARNARRDEQY